MADKDKLEKALEAAQKQPMTDEDREAQRRSFVFGNTQIEYPALTKDVVEDVAEQLSRDSE